MAFHWNTENSKTIVKKVIVGSIPETVELFSGIFIREENMTIKNDLKLEKD